MQIIRWSRKNKTGSEVVLNAIYGDSAKPDSAEPAKPLRVNHMYGISYVRISYVWYIICAYRKIPVISPPVYKPIVT